MNRYIHTEDTAAWLSDSADRQTDRSTTSVPQPLYRPICASRHLHFRTAEDFVGAKFYWPHVLADGNQRIRIRQKTPEFCSTVSSTLSRQVA